MDIKAFQWWLDKGLYRIGHFVNPASLNLAHCISKLDMPRTESFRYRQIANFLQSLRFSTSIPLSITDYERWCGQAMELRGGIYVIYRSLSWAETKSPFMKEWENDL